MRAAKQKRRARLRRWYSPSQLHRSGGPGVAGGRGRANGNQQTGPDFPRAKACLCAGNNARRQHLCDP